MPQQIDWSAKARVIDGPIISVASTVEVEAYDVTKVTVADGATDTQLVIQPDGPLDDVKLIMITADRYGDGVTYKINDTGGAASALDQPNVFAGKGAVSRLAGGNTPTRLFISNASGGEVVVQVFVGRDATP